MLSFVLFCVLFVTSLMIVGWEIFDKAIKNWTNDFDDDPKMASLVIPTVLGGLFSALIILITLFMEPHLFGLLPLLILPFRSFVKKALKKVLKSLVVWANE